MKSQIPSTIHRQTKPSDTERQQRSLQQKEKYLYSIYALASLSLSLSLSRVTPPSPTAATTNGTIRRRFEARRCRRLRIDGVAVRGDSVRSDIGSWAPSSFVVQRVHGPSLPVRRRFVPSLSLPRRPHPPRMCKVRHCWTFLAFMASEWIILLENWVTLIPKIPLLKYGFLYETVASSGASSFPDLSNRFIAWLSAISTNVLAWRNYIVAPITEELVFRACMIPLLLCGGFKPYSVILLCPVFFSLAHLNHFMEIYTKQNYRIMKAVMVIGLQLGYTVIFGSYASFLFLRTGHLLAPLVAHIYCNFMGLPVFFSRRSGIVSVVAFIMGFLGFLWLLFPMTGPDLYNDRVDNCSCWQGYCSWSVRNSSM